MISGLVMKVSTEQTIDAMSVLTYAIHVLHETSVLHASTTLPSILNLENVSAEIHTNLMVHPA
jgi:hypothetical protein